ncbi:MAG: AAA family ATPase [Wenzhouxiangella sp.]
MELTERTIDPAEVFAVPLPWPVPAFCEQSEHVPAADAAFRFMEEPTRAILMGFAHNRRVYIHGPHGSGKTSHIEQIAARLNWPVLRINLDGQITRADLIGRDMVVLRDGKQVTEYVPGLLVWALQRPICLILDEYDAGRPDVMFVVQRLLESNGRFTLLDKNEVIVPHPKFRLFATGNTAGQGDSTGDYVGTQLINQAQMDRWQVIVELNYPDEQVELDILLRQFPGMEPELTRDIVKFARLCRSSFRHGDISVLLSLRTSITVIENFLLIADMSLAVRLAFGNRCDSADKAVLSELYQRCFGAELTWPRSDA